MKQGGAQKEPNPTEIDVDTTGNTLEEETGKNVESRKPFHLDDEEVDSIPERSPCNDDEQEEKAHGSRRGFPAPGIVELLTQVTTPLLQKHIISYTVYTTTAVKFSVKWIKVKGSW